MIMNVEATAQEFCEMYKDKHDNYSAGMSIFIPISNQTRLVKNVCKCVESPFL